MEEYLFNAIAKVMKPFTLEANMLEVCVRDKGIVVVSAFNNDGSIFYNEDRQFVSAKDIPNRAWNKLRPEKGNKLYLFV